MPGIVDSVAFGFASTATSFQAATGIGHLGGWSIWESAGTPAAAQVRFHEGTGTGGKLLGGFKLAASGSNSGIFPSQGVRFQTGLYVEIVSGSVEGALYVY